MARKSGKKASTGKKSGSKKKTSTGKRKPRKSAKKKVAVRRKGVNKKSKSKSKPKKQPTPATPDKPITTTGSRASVEKSKIEQSLETTNNEGEGETLEQSVLTQAPEPSEYSSAFHKLTGGGIPPEPKIHDKSAISTAAPTFPTSEDAKVEVTNNLQSDNWMVSPGKYTAVSKSPSAEAPIRGASNDPLAQFVKNRVDDQSLVGISKPLEMMVDSPIKPPDEVLAAAAVTEAKPEEEENVSTASTNGMDASSFKIPKESVVAFDVPEKTDRQISQARKQDQSKQMGISMLCDKLLDEYELNKTLGESFRSTTLNESLRSVNKF